MNRIINEMLSKYIEGKTDFVIYGDDFESEDINEMVAVFDFFDELNIEPEDDHLKISGTLTKLNFTDEEKKNLKEKWAKRVIQEEIKKEKIDNFFEENQNAICESFYNSLDDDDDDKTHRVFIPKKEEFEDISMKIKEIFNNTSIYDDGKTLIFWHIGDTIKLNAKQLLDIIDILKFVTSKKCTFSLSIIPKFDFSDDENENATGVNFLLSINY